MTQFVFDAEKTIKELVPNLTPKVGIVLGSGLGPLADAIEEAISIPYEDLPGFPRLSVQGHTGLLTLGYLQGVPIACLQGRSHFYEGYSYFHADLPTDTLMTPVRTLKRIGCDVMLATNSSGSLRTDVTPGDLVLINDHINFQFNNPLVGKNAAAFGPRFVGMENAYDPQLRELIHSAAAHLKIELANGVYIGVLGPSFETPAEIRAFQTLGADVVGMSTIPEVITARHCGLRVAVISAITNMAAGLSDENLSHDVTLRGAKKAVEKLTRLVLGFFDAYKDTC